MPRFSAALLACIALLSAAIAAGTEQRRIVVLRPDEELLRAIALSLSAWGVETARSDALPPEPSQPEAVQAASRLARSLGAEAVVWVSRADRGSLLWVFDARAGDVTTRLLTETAPFDSAGAAAVALSVKTVLRSSVLAPPAERFGARPVPGPTEPSPSQRVFALELGAGGYLVADEQAELQLELAAVAWIAAARRLGVSLELAGGPGFPIDEAAYHGRYREIVAGASARYRFVREPTLSVAVALGGGVHVVSLEGTLVEGAIERDVQRVNPSLDLEVSVSGHFQSLYLGAALGAAYFPTYRRYLVEGEPVFSPWPVAVGLRGYCGVELF